MSILAGRMRIPANALTRIAVSHSCALRRSVSPLVLIRSNQTTGANSLPISRSISQYAAALTGTAGCVNQTIMRTWNDLTAHCKMNASDVSPEAYGDINERSRNTCTTTIPNGFTSRFITKLRNRCCEAID